ncbi:MAG: GAF domain-containing sensor histidine kinase [Halobacteriota archaeon]
MSASPSISDESTFTEACSAMHDHLQDREDVDATIEHLLEDARRYLGVENVHLTRIEPSTNYWEAIASTDGDDGIVARGESYDLEATYCRQVLGSNDVVQLHHASEQGWSDTLAYETHGLETYLGVPLPPGSDPFGTACFVSNAPRSTPFTDEELLFAEHLSHEIGRLLQRRQLRRTLDRRDQLTRVLSRLLRHNLRNDLNVIGGLTELGLEKADPDLADDMDHVLTRCERLRRLSEKAGDIESIVGSLDERESVHLESAIREVVAEVRDTHQDVRFEVEATDATLPLSPSIDRGLFELIDNAARHGPDGTTVCVTARVDGRHLVVDIVDDGHGIPETERHIFGGITETPLTHGSGIGLWLAYWIFDSQGGSMEVIDASNGAHLRVRLPISSVSLDR